MEAFAPDAATEDEEPAGELHELFFVAPGECARQPIEFIPAGKHSESLNIPDQALKVYGDKAKNGKLDMPYGEIQNGEAYCVDAGSDKPTILVGGTFMFETKDGECVAPPQTAAGQPCCEIFMWQPNSGGYYYDNCSMKCATLPLLLPCRFRCLTTTCLLYTSDAADE